MVAAEKPLLGIAEVSRSRRTGPHRDARSPPEAEAGTGCVTRDLGVQVVAVNQR